MWARREERPQQWMQEAAKGASIAVNSGTAVATAESVGLQKRKKVDISLAIAKSVKNG